MIFRLFRTRRYRADKGPPPEPSAPTIITADVDIEGNLVSAGELQIDGTVHGDVSARAAVIDRNGLVHGGVTAEEVIVRGRVTGPIRGVHVHIISAAHVEGDVISTTLSIENGAWVDGLIHRSDDPLSAPVPVSHAASRWKAAASYRQAYRDIEDEEMPPRPAQWGRRAAE